MQENKLLLSGFAISLILIFGCAPSSPSWTNKITSRELGSSSQCFHGPGMCVNTPVFRLANVTRYPEEDINYGYVWYCQEHIDGLPPAWTNRNLWDGYPMAYLRAD